MLAASGLLGSFEPSELNQQLAMIAGTSSCHMAVSPDRRIIPGVWGPYYSAMIPGLWLNEGGQSATGALLDHILDLHAEGRGLGPERHKRVRARVQELLASEGPGMSRDFQVLPDFNGNRSPLADAKATGVIHGLTIGRLIRCARPTLLRDGGRHRTWDPAYRGCA